MKVGEFLQQLGTCLALRTPEKSWAYIEKQYFIKLQETSMGARSAYLLVCCDYSYKM